MSEQDKSDSVFIGNNETDPVILPQSSEVVQNELNKQENDLCLDKSSGENRLISAYPDNVQDNNIKMEMISNIEDRVDSSKSYFESGDQSNQEELSHMQQQETEEKLYKHQLNNDEIQTNSVPQEMIKENANNASNNSDNSDKNNISVVCESSQLGENNQVNSSQVLTQAVVTEVNKTEESSVNKTGIGDDQNIKHSLELNINNSRSNYSSSEASSPMTISNDTIPAEGDSHNNSCDKEWLKLQQPITNNINTNNPPENPPIDSQSSSSLASSIEPTSTKVLQDDSDELLSELESELRNNPVTYSRSSDVNISHVEHKNISIESDKKLDTIKGMTAMNIEQVTEINRDSTNIPSVMLPNGIISKTNFNDIPEYKDLSKKYSKLQKFYIDKEMDVKRLSDEVSKLSDELCKTVKDRDVYIKKIEHLEENSMEKVHLAKISELENAIATVTKEHEDTKAKLASHDAAAKKAVNQLQNETQARIVQVTKVYEECKRDKEGMTVKYAMAEQKNLELQEKMARNERRMREMERERDNVVGRYKQMKTEKEKSDGNVLSRGQEIVNLRREIEKLKEIRTELESKTKWATAKLRTELESHKESKTKLEELGKKYKQFKDETELMKKKYETSIKEYQQNEVVKSMTLAVKLDQKEQALQQQQQEKSDQEEVHLVVKIELEKLKRRHKEMVEELKTYKDKVTCLEAERILQEETLAKFKETLQTQKQDNRNLYDRISELEKAEIELNNAKSEIESLKCQVMELSENNKDLRVDIDGCAKREGGHLEFSKRVSDKNAKLQSENSTLSSKLSTLQHEYDQLNSKYTELEENISKLEEDLKEENQQRIKENGLLSAKLEEKSRKFDEIAQELEDLRDQNKTIKRKHQANLKDLTRQLQQTKRKLEQCDRRSGNFDGRDSASMGSMGSRTSSTNSLNTVGENGSHMRGSSQEPSHPLPQEDEQPIVQFVEVDKQILVDKIVKLQRINARKSEKLEFMEDHVNHLIEELQKKHKIVQNYALREETGTLAPQEMDMNKIQLSKKGGIMASIYKRHSEDDHMSIDLSLEINKKLQAVLEDTLLKNITLKDNMDTLGKEIANISQKNRELQLHLHKLQGTTNKS